MNSWLTSKERVHRLQIVGAQEAAPPASEPDASLESSSANEGSPPASESAPSGESSPTGIPPSAALGGDGAQGQGAGGAGEPASKVHPHDLFVLSSLGSYLTHLSRMVRRAIVE